MTIYDFMRVSLEEKKTTYPIQRRNPIHKILSLESKICPVSVTKLLVLPTIGKGKSAQALQEPITIERTVKLSILKHIVLRYCINYFLLSVIPCVFQASGSLPEGIRPRSRIRIRSSDSSLGRLPEFLKYFGYLFLLVLITPGVSKACSGRFVNPISDICWSCLFPITIGPVNLSRSGREDTKNPSQIPCLCPRPPLPVPVPGIPVGFWEPARLVDVTRTPFCMVNLGGLQLGNNRVGSGTHGAKGTGRTQHSFYQVHWYIYPVIYWLELLTDFLCLEQQSFDVAYITELDPLWNEDELSFILNPEAAVFGNPLAQAACAADCAAASAGFPKNSLFWCGGCQGSLYPFTGNNTAHMGGVQASLLLTKRMIAKLHRELLLWGTSGKEALCQKYLMPVIKKSQYKTQMTYPRPTTRGPQACNPLGRTEVIWGSGREFPYKGEDFGYLIWRKRNCCAL